MCSRRVGRSVVDVKWLFVTPRLISFACFRITSRRFSPRMARSNQWKCQWTDCTPTCPGAPPTSSLRPLRRPRRPSSTWMEVVLLYLLDLWTFLTGVKSHFLFLFGGGGSAWVIHSVFLFDLPFLLNNSELSMIVVLSGQIDGQEITASAVLTQRVRPPPRRLSPPRRMPPPPPMWRRSPPRMRRRFVDQPCVLFQLVSVFIRGCLDSDHEYFRISVWQVSLPEEAVPSTAPLSLQITRPQAPPLSFQLQLLQINQSFFKNPSLISLTSWPPSLPDLNTDEILWIVANMNTRLHVERLFLHFWCKPELLQMFCGWAAPKQQFAIFIMSLGSAQATFCFKCDFFLSCIEFLDISKNKRSEIYVVWVHFYLFSKEKR